MARRSRSSFNPLVLLGGAAVIVIFAVGFLLFSKTSDPFRAEPLEIDTYLENSNSLRGNVYRVEGEVLNILGYSTTEGRLISVGTGANNDVIPMLIPASLGRINIQKGQKFIFLIEVTDQGILRAKDLTKA